MSGFAGLTAAHCAAALDLVSPSIEEILGRVAKRYAGNLVVGNPSTPREPKYKKWSVDPDDPFEELVLFETQWGDVSRWTAPFREVSRSKLFASWKLQMATRRMQVEAPWAYEEGWTKWPGSIWLPGNLVIAFSGVEDYFDEMICMLMHAGIWGVCMREMHGPDGVMANSDITFLPGS